jgi:chemotaxis protein MotB
MRGSVLTVAFIAAATVVTPLFAQPKIDPVTQWPRPDCPPRCEHLQGATKYTIDSDLLFPPGSWQLSAQGHQIIAKLAAKLVPTPQNKIVVKGYSDDTPIGSALLRQGVISNKVLSQRRAESVMQSLISRGLNPDLVSAVGYGEANPVASNHTAKGRAQNRRVELMLVD